MTPGRAQTSRAARPGPTSPGGRTVHFSRPSRMARPHSRPGVLGRDAGRAAATSGGVGIEQPRLVMMSGDVRRGSCPNPTCQWDAWERDLPDRDASDFDCRRCGRYKMASLLIRAFRGGLDEAEDQGLLPYLSAYSKQANEAGIVPVFEASTWRDLARTHAATSSGEKLWKLLMLFRRRSAHLGNVISIVAVEDCPLIDAPTSEEMVFLLEELRRRRHIEWPLVIESGGHIRQMEATKEPLTRGRLTVQGWHRVEEGLNAGGEGMAKEFDVFISHASEDKTEAALPLAQKLRALGHEVWYADFVLTMGDSLRRKIDEGLTRSRFGVVILSPAFFAKEWPQKELDGLVAREIGGVKVILPVWHRINAAGVVAKSPTLADRVAARMEEGLDEVVRKIVEVLGPPRGTPSAAPRPTPMPMPSPKAAAVGAETIAGWSGVEWNDRFLCYEGPVESLRLIEDAPFQQSMAEAVQEGEYQPRLARPDNIGRYADDGYRLIYVTDRRSWRRRVVQGDVVLIARPLRWELHESPHGQGDLAIEGRTVRLDQAALAVYRGADARQQRRFRRYALASPRQDYDERTVRDVIR